MSKDFVMIVAGRDAERFRRFRTCEDGAVACTLGTGRDAVNLWAVSAASGGTAWDKIKRGDRVFFAEYGSRFAACGTVSGTVLDSSTAIRTWGDTPRMRMLDRFVLFSRVREVSEPFGRTCREAGIEPSEFTALHESAGRIGTHLSGSGSQIYEIPAAHGMIAIPVDGDGPPERATEAVTRFVRDTEKAQKIKRLYRDRCQVCGIAIKVPGGKRYSEVHHLHPLKEGGDDSYGNMIVLCPNHHAEFDYRAVGISKDGSTIVDWRGREVGKVTTARGHSIDQKNIMYHTEAMRRA